MFASRTRIFWIIVVFILLFLSILFFLTKAEKINYSRSNSPGASEEISRLPIGDTVVDIEIVRTAEDRTKGLSGRKQLASQSGMLFIFDEPGFHGIWMKDMNFSLDIIWIDENFYVVDIKKSVGPDTYPQVFKPRSPASYVLEVNSGFSELYNVEIGSEVEISLNSLVVN